MTRSEKMTTRLNEWRAGLDAMERKLTELTLQIERQRGAIIAAEALLTMADDESVARTADEQPASAPESNEAT